MMDDLTLSDLDNELRALKLGQATHLSRTVFVRLFGVNDAAKGRLINFAKHHDCAVIWFGELLQFKKRPPT